jgi:hypothetical protein
MRLCDCGKKKCPKYRTVMVLAHIRQVPVADSATLIANFQDFRGWNVARILEDTERIVNGGGVGKLGVWAGPWSPLVCRCGCAGRCE